MKHILPLALLVPLLSALATAQISTANFYLLPNYPEYPNGIVAGPDGNLWFTTATNYTGSIGRIDMSGNVTEYLIPYDNASPKSITIGSDGNVWFLDLGTNSIGQVTITNSPPPLPR